MDGAPQQPIQTPRFEVMTSPGSCASRTHGTRMGSGLCHSPFSCPVADSLLFSVRYGVRWAMTANPCINASTPCLRAARGKRGSSSVGMDKDPASREACRHKEMMRRTTPNPYVADWLVVFGLGSEME